MYMLVGRKVRKKGLPASIAFSFLSWQLVRQGLTKEKARVRKQGGRCEAFHLALCPYAYDGGDEGPLVVDATDDRLASTCQFGALQPGGMDEEITSRRLGDKTVPGVIGIDGLNFVTTRLRHLQPQAFGGMGILSILIDKGHSLTGPEGPSIFSKIDRLQMLSLCTACISSLFCISDPAHFEPMSQTVANISKFLFSGVSFLGVS